MTWWFLKPWENLWWVTIKKNDKNAYNSFLCYIEYSRCEYSMGGWDCRNSQMWKQIKQGNEHKHYTQQEYKFWQSPGLH